MAFDGNELETKWTDLRAHYDIGMTVDRTTYLTNIPIEAVKAYYAKRDEMSVEFATQDRSRGEYKNVTCGDDGKIHPICRVNTHEVKIDVEDEVVWERKTYLGEEFYIPRPTN